MSRDELLTVLVLHAKECASESCSACECGWMGTDERTATLGGLFVHAEHLADQLTTQPADLRAGANEGEGAGA